jgi:hypothetical protein
MMTIDYIEWLMMMMVIEMGDIGRFSFLSLSLSANFPIFLPRFLLSVGVNSDPNDAVIVIQRVTASLDHSDHSFTPKPC